MKIYSVFLIACLLPNVSTAYDYDKSLNQGLKLAQNDSIMYAMSLKSLHITERESGYILQTAYPLAGIFGGLTFRNADVVNSIDTGSGYAITTKLNYLNLIDQYQYVKITFYYDYRGNGDYWEFSGHSDVIAPKQLTAKTLLQFLSSMDNTRQQ